MDENQPFGGFICAVQNVGNGQQQTTAAVLIYRPTKAEALLMARELCLERYPADKGYYAHQYEVVGMDSGGQVV